MTRSLQGKERGPYDYEATVVRPIQQELRDQYQEVSAEREESPTFAPTLAPSASLGPSDVPSLLPSDIPSAGPSESNLLSEFDVDTFPSLAPSDSSGPSDFPSLAPSDVPSEAPSPSILTSDFEVNTFPSLAPSESDSPSLLPSLAPSASPGPSDLPSLIPSLLPSDIPTVDDGGIIAADVFPSLQPSLSPKPSSFSDIPSLVPSDLPSEVGLNADLLDKGIVEEPLQRDDPLSDTDTPMPTEMPTEKPLLLVEELSSDDDPLGGGKKDITCDLDATIECETMDGEACLFSHIPSEDEMCQGSPSQLSWVYKGGDCTGSSDRTVICEDLVDGGPSTADSVFIEIHGEEPEEVYYQGYANSTKVGSLDSIIELNRPFSKPMEHIFVHIKRTGQNGELLQMLVLPNACHPKKGLVIGNTYGALQFGGYTTATKSVQGYKHLEWTFAATSEAGLNLTVKTATAVLGSNVMTFRSGESLSPGQEASFVCYETISLGKADLFSGAVTVIAQGSDGMECAAAAASYIKM